MSKVIKEKPFAEDNTNSDELEAVNKKRKLQNKVLRKMVEDLDKKINRTKNK